ncbi:2,3-bisphosphoglycerate-dependent phosphoglycerate mutase [Candidatus Saccharibacteria bacterium]|nr:2,3-bisphosphoglycerate-dependent phosphoglycerate mutase [Candidatus Saccharibacteria bacterium]
MKISKKSGLLVLVRHGESEWNKLAKWTGHTDVGLTKKGIKDAGLMGELLQDIHFNKAYISPLVRTEETLNTLLITQGQTDLKPVVAKALNERDYGIYTGLNKWEVQKKIGHTAFQAVRRGFNTPIPKGESLRVVYERVVPFYKKVILPQLKSGENVLIVSHGNTIRALSKYLFNFTDRGISRVEMLFDEILLVRVNSYGKATSKRVRKIPNEQVRHY